MYFLYSIVLTVGFIILLPRFVLDAIVKGKYAAGFEQRLGFLPAFNSEGRKVVWLHCVSVGETNAARALVQAIGRIHPNLTLVVSTTTRTGQELARDIFRDQAALVFYFPLDWRWTVRRAIRHIKPSAVLMMETEIWFNFYREAYKANARVCLINGRLSERSFKRYGKIRKFIKRVLGYVELALMQDKSDATRLMSLGIRGNKVKVTGNLKFDHDVEPSEAGLTETFSHRFNVTPDIPLIIAASTHSPEEKWVLEAFRTVSTSGEQRVRLLIAPRHPERFGEVQDLIRRSGFTWVRRSEAPSDRDKTAAVILLDSIGELRAVYPLAEIVFVGGSLIPHGGQSVYEPAAAGRPIITGPYTSNFAAAMKEFFAKGAVRQIESVSERDAADKLAEEFSMLLTDAAERKRLSGRALTVMRANRGAVEKTMDFLEPVLTRIERR